MSPTRPRCTLIRGTPYFPVSDVARTGQYYRDVLDFQLEYSAGSPPEFAIYSRDGAALMLRRLHDPSRIRPIEAQGGTWDAFYWVSDILSLHEEFAARGARFSYGLTLQPYGMHEFAVRDPDGHVLGFGQALPPPGP